MKSDNILAALNDIDPELIEDAQGQHKSSRKVVFLKWGAAVAVFCLICAFALDYIFPINPDIPVYKDALYSASEIADFFGGTYNAGGTSSYTKVYVPSLEFLDFHCSIPAAQYLPIYQRHTATNDLSLEEFEQFASTRIEQIAEELGIATPSYTIEETPLPDHDKSLDIRLFDTEGYDLYATQNSSLNCFFFSSAVNPWQEICLGDVRIEVDQTESDEEIIASLSEVKEKLFYVFGAEFSDIKIRRHYNDYSNHGVASIHIYFYNESDHPLNSVMDAPYSDYIYLVFDNAVNHAGDVVSNTVLQKVDIAYYQFRTDTKELYTVSKLAPAISLQDAEAFLYNGYVFGGHSCPLCMSMQEKVDFHNYDFVDIVYLSSYSTNLAPKEILPFYAFYKKIGTAKNGNEIYALTYVPAIEVSGYEEYFKSQEANHRT